MKVGMLVKWDDSKTHYPHTEGWERRGTIVRAIAALTRTNSRRLDLVVKLDPHCHGAEEYIYWYSDECVLLKAQPKRFRGE